VRAPYVRGPVRIDRLPNVDTVMSERYVAIYQQHSAALRRFVRRRVETDAVEDVLAQTFLTAWRRLPKEFADDDALPWLYAVASGAIQNHYRGVGRRRRLTTRLIAHHDRRHGVGPAELIVEDPALARAFAELTDFDREAICLIAWEGLSNVEAARVAGCSPATFAVRYSRARTRLAAALAKTSSPISEARPSRSSCRAGVG
jgi:RNA polymerase sigma factor (sigma-70 family)